MQQQQTNQPVKAKTQQKFPLGNLIKWIVFGIFLAGTAVSFVFHEEVFGETAIFNTDISSNQVLNFVFQKIPALIRSVQIITVAYVINLIVKFVGKYLFARTKRAATVVTLLSSFLKYAIAIVALLFVLSAWGVDTGTLLASAGILGLVIGLAPKVLLPTSLRAYLSYLRASIKLATSSL